VLNSQGLEVLKEVAEMTLASRPLPSVEQIRDSASTLAFGSRLVQNNLRSLVVEVIVGSALGLAWKHCSGDWNGWDFEHESGTRLEVKQSALLQTWKSPATTSVARVAFDIALRKGVYKGATWTSFAGRNADIYVFSLHTEIDELADHRDPKQWRFYVVSAGKLPANQRRIGVAKLNQLVTPCGWSELAAAVEKADPQAACGAFGDCGSV
jgi:hypothetical protein